ncbi:hypothetical protein PRIPAC_77814 [Pristionchus pacificus]|uniref:DUF148 domain-containing protein n=1 Tax=Pristionchus pacificus TaxID=54126 RepID=A0A2A6C388_PRIPA|nr:hypothetical protein PRIPAC_77814 [Pristionchus pacificus]|eukprot:PDM72493.1 hypothetical protein PRIPAC_38927 [Pristionchus pacificus]
MQGLFFLITLLIATALATSGDDLSKSPFRNGPAQRPPFFDKVSASAKEEYLENMYDLDKARSEIYEDEIGWGREQGIEDEVRTFQEQRAAFYAEHTERVIQAIEDLPNAYVKMRSYFNDLSLTHNERERAIHRQFKASSFELRALLQATRAANMDKLNNGELFPSYKRRAQEKEVLRRDIKENNSL